MTQSMGLIFFRGDFHLPRRFQVLFRVIHRIVVMAGTTGRGVILSLSCAPIHARQARHVWLQIFHRGIVEWAINVW